MLQLSIQLGTVALALEDLAGFSGYPSAFGTRSRGKMQAHN
jgi:hypothetical protein